MYKLFKKVIINLVATEMKKRQPLTASHHLLVFTSARFWFSPQIIIAAVFQALAMYSLELSLLGY